MNRREEAIESGRPVGQRPLGRPRALALVGLLGLGALGSSVLSCSAPSVAARNLDALHNADGKYRYRASLLTPLRAALAQLLTPRGFTNDLLNPEKVVDVPDPAGATLKNALDLAAGTASPSAVAHRVRQFAYLAVADPSGLVRERALLELGRLAQDLQLDEPLAQDAQPANAPELSEAIAGLAQVVRPLVANTDPLSATERADLTAACELLASMTYDVEGGKRILAVIASLLDRRADDEAFAPLRRLAARVERSVTSIALSVGLRDKILRARAAAFEANWRAYGDDFLSEALLALSAANPEAQTRFGLGAVWPGDEPVFVAVLDLVRENGLPGGPPTAADLAARRLRLAHLHALCQVAVDYTAFSERSRTAAMLALSAVSGAGFSSLRMEDWQAWWQEYAPREYAAVDAEAQPAEPANLEP